uniref:Shootin-1 n=1 Tax=Anopheles farauti TaxID=69004 RepID=A0A182Q1J2_9DIPT
MDISQTSPSKRSSIPIPKRKTSLHLYIAGGGSSSNSSSNVGSASASINDDEPSFTRSMLGSFVQAESPPGGGGEGTASVTPSEYVQLKESHNRLMEKCEQLTKRNAQLEQSNEQLNHSMSQLIRDLANSQKALADFTDVNRHLRRKLSTIIPTSVAGEEGTADAAESDEEPDAVISRKAANTTGSQVANDTSRGSEVDGLLNEMEKLKSYLNNVELQLYEANEKTSELLENKQQYEESNQKLREENVELKKVARLMSRNMLESIDTSKRLENSFIQVQRERDHLVRQNRDSVDSKTTTNDEIQKMRSEIELQRKTYEAQFIEYKSLMSEEHERKTNDQIVALELEVETLRTQLGEALQRAERAEGEVQTLRQLLRVSRLREWQGSGSAGSNILEIPEALDSDPLVALLNRCHLPEQASSLAASSSCLDSVIADIKSGKVTLRRRRPNIPNNSADDGKAGGTGGDSSIRDSQRNFNQMAARNPGLQEMYDILERMKRRNRKSKIIVESELFGSRSSGSSNTVPDQTDAPDEDRGARTNRTRLVMDVVDL